MKMKKSSTTTEDLISSTSLFPSARYFQIHFQYLQEIIGDLHLQMENANQQIAELQNCRSNCSLSRPYDTKQNDYGKKLNSYFEQG